MTCPRFRWGHWARIAIVVAAVGAFGCAQGASADVDGSAPSVSGDATGSSEVSRVDTGGASESSTDDDVGPGDFDAAEDDASRTTDGSSDGADGASEGGDAASDALFGADTGSDASPCMGTSALCGGVCTDLTSDENCGSCGNACDTSIFGTCFLSQSCMGSGPSPASYSCQCN